MSFSEEHEMVDNSNGVAHLFITEGPSTTTHQAHPHNRRKNCRVGEWRVNSACIIGSRGGNDRIEGRQPL
jgi:hypothetical protein